MIDREKIKALVREKLQARLPATQPVAAAPVFDFVSAKEIRSIQGKVLRITPGAVITPLARDIAAQEGIEFQPVLPNQSALVDSPTVAQGMSRTNPQAIAIGADHGGFELKQLLLTFLQQEGYAVQDMGTQDTQAVDYPDYAHAVAQVVARGECRRGIIIDGAGIGSAITANKVPGIRAAHCHNLFEVKNSRAHNDANILSLGARVIGTELAKAMVKLWLETPFSGGRHQRRVAKISAVERQYLK